MVNETWLETDSKLFYSHFSLFSCNKIRVYTTQSLQKRENRHLYLCKISMEKLEGDYSNLEWKKLGERTLVAQNTACRKLHNTTKSHEQCRKLRTRHGHVQTKHLLKALNEGALCW